MELNGHSEAMNAFNSADWSCNSCNTIEWEHSIVRTWSAIRVARADPAGSRSANQAFTR